MTVNNSLHHLIRPARYTGGELGSITKDWAQVDVTFALAFPDVYEVGMSHIGSGILYRVLNDVDWIAAERTYTPWPDWETQLREAGEPLSSLESGRPLSDFDIVGFSLQYELCYSNVLNMLDLAGLPLRSADRDDTAPLIVAGGPCAFNPEPIAEFIDCAIIGDAEEAVVELCEALRESKHAGESKATLLKRLSGIEGVYVPSLFTVTYLDDGRLEKFSPEGAQTSKVRRRVLTDLDKALYPTEPIVPFLQTIHDRVAVEVARGCTRGCRFCQAGYIYRPVRERSPETVLRLIEESLRHSGYDEVSLLSLSTGDYSAIEPLMQNLMSCYAEQRIAVSLPSLRVGSLTPELMDEIKKVRKTGFTLAPEAGSERLRNVINKGIEEDDLVSAAASAFELGWRVIKLYFMIGLPTETDEDIEALVDLAARVKATGRGSEGGADVNVSVSTFVPKAHTPFQWEPQISIEETLARQAHLRSALKRKKLKFKWHEAELSFLEGVFARGDRRLGKVIEEAVRLGCRFDGWREHFRWDLWQQAFSNTGVDAEGYLRRRAPGETLPWDHIDAGISKDFLLRERQAALMQKETADCRHGQCSYCGLCDFEQVRPRLTSKEATTVSNEETLQANEEPALLPKLRLTVTKTGRTINLSHLEFMTLIHRAVRRAGLPIKYSSGFHPAPRISFGDALPVGIESDAELIDLELSAPCADDEAYERLKGELPDGVTIRSIITWPRKGPSPADSVASATYQIPLPEQPVTDLEARIAAFLAADEVLVKRRKKKKVIDVDLRPWVFELEYAGETLTVVMGSGSPLLVAGHLLGLDIEEARALGIRKTAVSLKDFDCQTDD